MNKLEYTGTGTTKHSAVCCGVVVDNRADSFAHHGSCSEHQANVAPKRGDQTVLIYLHRS